MVSDNGDNLSPKYAPEIIAPAVSAGGKPKDAPIPIKATPIVAHVLHELPILTETKAQTITALA